MLRKNFFQFIGLRADHDNDEARSRSKSFPVDPANLHIPLSPQSSMDSDEENQLRKNSNLTSDNSNPGMKGLSLFNLFGRNSDISKV